MPRQGDNDINDDNRPALNEHDNSPALNDFHRAINEYVAARHDNDPSVNVRAAVVYDSAGKYLYGAVKHDPDRADDDAPEHDLDRYDDCGFDHDLVAFVIQHAKFIHSGRIDDADFLNAAAAVARNWE